MLRDGVHPDLLACRTCPTWAKSHSNHVAPQTSKGVRRPGTETEVVVEAQEILTTSRSSESSSFSAAVRMRRRARSERREARQRSRSGSRRRLLPTRSGRRTGNCLTMRKRRSRGTNLYSASLSTIRSPTTEVRRTSRASCGSKRTGNTRCWWEVDQASDSTCHHVGLLSTRGFRRYLANHLPRLARDTLTSLPSPEIWWRTLVPRVR